MHLFHTFVEVVEIYIEYGTRVVKYSLDKKLQMSMNSDLLADQVAIIEEPFW